MDIWCDECGAQFKESCSCSPKPPSGGNDTWVGIDGHKYIGDKKRASLADHADDCRCRTNPEDWY